MNSFRNQQPVESYYLGGEHTSYYLGQEHTSISQPYEVRSSQNFQGM